MHTSLRKTPFGTTPPLWRFIMSTLLFVTWLLLMLLGSSIVAAGQSVTLAWNANTETNLAGYRLYWGSASRSYSTNMTVLVPETTATVTNLPAGPTNYFAVTAYTTDGLESDYSDEVFYRVPVPPPTPPKPPTQFRIVTSLQALNPTTGRYTNVWTVNTPIDSNSPALFYLNR